MTPHRLLRTVIFPLVLILCSPIAVVLIWWTCTAYDGSLAAMVADFSLGKFARAWPWPSLAALRIIGAFAAFEALLMVALPGRRMNGPITPSGNRVVYKLNGVLAWLVTHVAFIAGAYWLEWFSPSIVYDHFGSIITTCSSLALLFCVVLYFKGIHFPSSPDAGRIENPIFDYFWGTELHPRWRNFDFKQFANCRLGMMGWSLIVLSFAARQRALDGRVAGSMLVAVALQMIYVARFFWTEHWYFSTLDVMHDRFGFYLCWGVTTWLPVVYTSQALYLVRHPIQLGVLPAALIGAVGLLGLYITCDADRQRQRVRAANGQCTVWGRRPELIVAHYATSDGQTKQSLLLASGWWGVARHFHYLGEVALALAWTVPCGFTNFLPYFYPSFLIVLLTHRALRDDRRCSEKYGRYWAEYCARVRYRIVPGLF